MQQKQNRLVLKLVRFDSFLQIKYICTIYTKFFKIILAKIPKKGSIQLGLNAPFQRTYENFSQFKFLGVHLYLFIHYLTHAVSNAITIIIVLRTQKSI